MKRQCITLTAPQFEQNILTNNYEVRRKSHVTFLLNNDGKGQFVSRTYPFLSCHELFGFAMSFLVLP